MDQQRGRSPSMGHQPSHINQNHSPSPQQFQEDVKPFGLGLGVETSGSNNQYPNSGFNPTYNDNGYLSQQGQFPQGGIGNPSYGQDFNQQFKQEETGSLSPFSQQQQQPTSFTQELLSANPNFNNGDFNLFSAPSGQEQLDTQYFMNEFSPRSGNQSINPAELDMASPPINTATPPHLLQPDHSHSPASAHQSPSFNQNQFQSSPGHSRHASLGPESAAFPQGQQQHEWSMMPPQFQGHRRSPSEYSDVSSHSAAHSPNLGHHDTFDSIEQHHSPMQNPQDAGLYSQVLGIGDFSLSDPQIQHGSSPGRGLSPAHSPAISPRLGPQQMSNFNQQNQFILNANNGFGQTQNVYGPQGNEQFPPMQQSNGSLDMGQAQQMAPPEINVEFAPASRQNSFEPPKPSLDQDALTPPERGM